MSSKLILFSLALSATPADVKEVVDAIHRTFNVVNDDNGVPPAAVAAAQNSAPPAATGTGELDSKGMRWDARIHSSSKATNADGSWRGRKGLDAATKAAVEAEIKSTVAPTTVVNNLIPPALVAPAAPQLPLPPVAPLETPYTRFVQFITENTHSAENPTGRLTDAWVQQTLLAYGIAEGSLQNLAHRPELVETIHNAIKTALGL